MRFFYLWYLKEKYYALLKIQNGIANSIIVNLPRTGNILNNKSTTDLILYISFICRCDC